MQAAKQQKTVNRAATAQPAASIKQAAAPSLVIQPSLKVSSPKDSAELEADATAKKIMRMSLPPVYASSVPSPVVARKPLEEKEKKLQKLESPYIARFSAAKLIPRKKKEREEEKIQRKGQGETHVSPTVAAEIGSSLSGGSPLSGEVRGFMEPRFRADFSGVRIHTGQKAASLSRKLNAQAFTVGNSVFFGKDQYRPESGAGKELIAHELTHTIQQGAVVRRSEEVTISQSSPPAVQRLGISDALDFFADKANMIPGFRMFTIILGVNPINMSRVERSAANILRAMVEFIPGGGLVTQALDGYGIFDKVGRWVEQQIATLGMTGSAIKQAVTKFLDSLGWRDIFNLGDVWNRAKRIFTEPIERIISFAKGLITGILGFIREAILRPLAKLAEGTRGYDLLKAILGQDPVTGDPVPRNADTLIGGFMKLIGQEEVWQNLKKGNAVARAWAWFQGALAGLMGFVRAIPQKIVATITSLTIQDVVSIAGAFTKVVGAFADIAGQFIGWGVKQVIGLLEILFSVVAPGAVPYIKKAQNAFQSIIKNPIGFVGNLVKAGKLGFEMFAANIIQHLKAALIKWLVGPLADAGVYIPKSFSLVEIVKLVLSVLGLTWQNIRAKLVKIIPEPVLAGLEKTAAILVTLVKEGPAAAWEQIKGELNELKEQLISQITQMISVEVVKAAVMKLVSMLNPAGAVVQAIIAIYNTITFFVEKINQIAAVVASFIDSIAAIAAGQVAGAAKRVEQTMANTLTVVIAFLAKFAGLGGIPQKLVGIVRKIRAPIDKGLDKIVGWLGNMLKKLGGAVKAGVKRLLNWWKKKVPVSGGGENHTLTFEGSGSNPKLVIRSAPEQPSVFLTNSAKSKGIEDKKSKGPIEIAKTHEKAVGTIQEKLKKFDEDAPSTPGGKEADKADVLIKELDQKMGTLGGHLVATLQDWKVADDEIQGVNLPRGSFTVEQKRGIAGQHKDKSQLRENTDKELINLEKGLARRHVVSSHDMAKHYEKMLNGKTISQGKLLLEQRGAITDARTRVEELSQGGIQNAAKSRYSRFFGYLRNMFIGDSLENSRIQEHLDRGNPELVGQKLDEHVRHVKRAWALDQSMEISGVDKK